jgi:hypothetical protein
VLELCLAFARVWAATNAPLMVALVLEKSRALRPTFVQPGCTGTANRIPSLALFAGPSGSRFDAIPSPYWTNPDARRRWGSTPTQPQVSSPDDGSITTMVSMTMIMELPNEENGSGSFKVHCLAVMDEVQAKRETVVITKNGKPCSEAYPCRERSRRHLQFSRWQGCYHRRCPFPLRFRVKSGENSGDSCRYACCRLAGARPNSPLQKCKSGHRQCGSERGRIGHRDTTLRELATLSSKGFQRIEISPGQRPIPMQVVNHRVLLTRLEKLMCCRGLRRA